MRLAVSNIAWPTGADDLVAPVLVEHGAEGVEIAPTKIWSRPLEASAEEVRAYHDYWERRGLPIVAMQSLLFGQPDLVLFGTEPVRRQTVDYLKGMIDLASALGASAMVFGSPKNRQVGPLPHPEADAIAVSTFRELGDHAARRQVAFCIEANPVAYGCDFITTTSEAIDLVSRVNSEGFGLHFDTGGMTLSGDDPALLFAQPLPHLRHLHISEPHLAPISRGRADHAAFSRALRRLRFDAWVSVEMKEANDPGPWLDALRESLSHARRVYLEGVES